MTDHENSDSIRIDPVLFQSLLQSLLPFFLGGFFPVFYRRTRLEVLSGLVDVEIVSSEMVVELIREQRGGDRAAFVPFLVRTEEDHRSIR
jgi:hypothetical protein